jgi:predicted TIM-barrel fold metal-dependent hydrolase
MVRAGFVDRLMFGSDQMAWPETIGKAIEAVESADFLTADQKCDIFFNNAVRFFRLDADALKKSSWPR